MKKWVYLIFVIGTICLFFSGCSNKHPSDTEISSILLDNREDFKTIVRYLRSLNYDYLYIDSDNGLSYYELSFHKINSDNVQISIHNLWNNGCESVRMCREEEMGKNTIWFQFWNGTGDRFCGLSCTVDGSGEPNVWFQIESKEIEPGWFYYYADYELFRTTKGVNGAKE